eukprot:7967-Heterococcus_DN1.PRE.1
MEYVVNDDNNGENSDSDTETNDENVENKVTSTTNSSSTNNTGSNAGGIDGVLQKQQSTDSDTDNTTKDESTDNKQSAKIGSVTLVAGKGDVYHNGIKLKKQQRVLLQPLDRVVIGSEVLLYRHSCNPLDTPERREAKQASAEYAVAEYQKALLTGNSNRRKTVEVAALEEQLKSLQ